MKKTSLTIIWVTVLFTAVVLNGCSNENSGIDSYLSSADDLEIITQQNNVNDFLYYIEDNTVTITFYKGQGNSVNIPDTIENLPVTQIGDAVFYKHTEIKNITIPNTVISIGENAFEDCTSLTEINIPESVEVIGYEAFEGTKWLENQTDDFVIIGSGILYKYKGNSTAIDIPQQVNIISGLAFANNSNITKISMSDKVAQIDKNAFWNCSHLKTVKLSNNISAIADNLFSGCIELEEVNIPMSVTSIGDWAFFECSSLKKLSLGMEVKTIGANSFMGCSSITLQVKSNSYSENYVINSKIPFEYF